MFQGEIALGAGDSIAFMNQKSRHKIACAVSEHRWQESIKSIPEAVMWANYCEQHSLAECYASDNTFKDWRNVTNIKEITRLAVDLDYYKTKYSSQEAIELWELIAEQNPWLPKPTIIEASGRGAYLKWKLARPLPINNKTKKFNFLGQWQVCQDFLVDRLKQYGADPKAADVTRVLRVAGTINSNSLTRAQAWTCGPEYEFSEIKKRLNDEYKRTRPPQKKPPDRSKSTTPVERLFNWHSLAFARLRDIERLAELRGGRFTDNRRRAIFCYAVELANYCRSEQSIRNDLERFITQHIENPKRYDINGTHIHLREVIRRFQVQEERGHWEWFMHDNTGRYGKDNRYLLKTSTIIDDLEITEREQKHLKALVGDSEKYRRKVKKRRSKGIQKRSEYEGKAKDRKQQARIMKSEGLSTREIAKALGVSERTARHYTKK